MAVEFLLEEKYREDVIISSDYPVFCKPYILPDATISYTDWREGSFLTQEIFGDDYTICEYRFFIKQKVKVFPITSKPLLTLVYILKGNVNCVLEGFGPIDLEEGKYYFFYVPSNIHHEANFVPGDYILFHINLDPNYVSKLTDKYKSVKEIVSMQQSGLPLGMKELSAPLSLRTRVVIEQITQCKEEDPAKDFFLQARIYDLLMLYSKDIEKAKESAEKEFSDPLVNKYIDKLLQARNILDANSGPPVHISTLSRKLGLNKQTLKKLFKVAFGHTIYAYQVHIRMEKASERLMNSRVSIDEVAADAGYKNTSSFIGMFKKVFGITPLQYHNRYNK